jgi:hypothetical protein
MRSNIMRMTEQIKNALSVYLGPHDLAQRRLAALDRLARAMGFDTKRGAGRSTMISELADGKWMLVPTPSYMRGHIPQDGDGEGEAE